MKQTPNNKQFDLEERCLRFAKRVRAFVKKLPWAVANIEDGRQLIKSSGSMGANYIEANESLSRKDFLMRVKIAKKESKESIYWLNLVDPLPQELKEQEYLIDEAGQLMKIFGSILEKSKHC